MMGCTHVSNRHPEAVSKPITTLSQSSPCCTDFSQLRYKELPQNYRATLAVNSEDFVIELDSGKTYAEAIALPESSKTILLEVESIVSYPTLYKPSSVLFPAITLLDDKHQPIITLDDLPFSFDTSFGIWRHLHMIITLDHQYKNARYALIHTTGKRLKQSLSTQKPFRIIQNSGFDTIAYVQPSKSNKRIRFSEQGVINVLAYISED